MVDFSNFVVALAAILGLIVLVVGRVLIRGRDTSKGAIVLVAGAVLLLPWPASQGLAIMEKVAREMDGNPPDKPETCQLITAFVQLVLMVAAGVTFLVLILVVPHPERVQATRTSGSKQAGM